jgi:hypothetical protein
MEMKVNLHSEKKINYHNSSFNVNILVPSNVKTQFKIHNFTSLKHIPVNN